MKKYLLYTKFLNEIHKLKKKNYINRLQNLYNHFFSIQSIANYAMHNTTPQIPFKKRNYEVVLECNYISSTLTI